ncbi:allatostatin-A receptor-like [Tubulanus polymorphus]|uniref:allatostatin-A receptor-like n=1 Tax=Tubulanus polymorphus TaxID=672921 RepID=UPI003DA54935
MYENSTEPPGNMTNSTASEADFYFEKVIAIVVPVIFCMISVIGFVGNVLVIIVVVSNKQMRNTTNILIISLAIADLSFIVICVPFTASNYALKVWPFGDLWCKVVQYMMFVTAYASVYTLVLMSFDRYLAVVHAIWAMNYRTERNAYICVIVLWIVILVTNTPVLTLYTELDYMFYDENRSTCTFKNVKDPNNKAPRIVFGIFFGMGYTLPLTLVCLLYGFMLNRLLYGVAPRLSHSAETVRSKKRVSRMVIIVVVIFALCWLPNQVMFMLQWNSKARMDELFVIMQTLGQVLSYLNSCINPILYAFLSENFRKGFRKVLCLNANTAMRNTDFERTNTRPLLTGATSLKSMGQTTENGL